MTSFQNKNLIKLIFSQHSFKDKLKLPKIIFNSYLLDTLLHSNTTANTINPKGILLYHSDLFPQALEIFDHNIALDDCHNESRYYKALTLIKLDNYMDALKVLIKLQNQGIFEYSEIQKDISICRRNLYGESSYFMNKAESLYVSKHFNEAIEYYDKVILIKSDDYNAHNNKANALTNIKQYDEALESFDIALGLTKRTGNIYYNKAFLLRIIGRLEEAVECLDHAVKLQPENCQYFNNKGYVLAEMGRYEEAIVCYNEAIRLKPNYVLTIKNKAQALEKLIRYDEAIACYKMVLEIDPSDCEAGVKLERLIIEMN
jgi:tetratricopeptide (TPR) repeat protein